MKSYISNFQPNFSEWWWRYQMWCMSLDLIEDKSTLVQVMAWCRQATSHYLSQCWPRSLSPYDVTRPQWVNQAEDSLRQWLIGWHLLLTQVHRPSRMIVWPDGGQSSTLLLNQGSSSYFYFNTLTPGRCINFFIQMIIFGSISCTFSVKLYWNVCH